MKEASAIASKPFTAAQAAQKVLAFRNRFMQAFTAAQAAQKV